MLTDQLFAYLRRERAAVEGLRHRPDLGDEDASLALYCCYELAYRGFEGVDADAERDLEVLALRVALEDWFLDEVRDAVSTPDVADPALAVAELIGRPAPSMADHLLADGTTDQVREALVLRSAYLLKEADPHTFAIPRLVGPEKQVVVDIQAGEYGLGHGQSHADIWAATMAAAGLDPAYGTYLDQIPGRWLAPVNLISMFATQRRLRFEALGHLAYLEMDSVAPNEKMVRALERLGFDESVRRWFEVHVLADAEHGPAAKAGILRAATAHDPVVRRSMIFGAAAAWELDRRAAGPTIDAWQASESALLSSASVEQLAG